MASTVAPTSERLVLNGISWETYQRLLAEHEGRTSPRFTYDRGALEIMVISFEHEELNRLLHDLFTFIADEFGFDFVNAGSTTFQREDIGRGFEPDTCFYVSEAERVRGRKALELPEDPPPEVVIEVDISNSSIDKMAIYAAMGIPEVWRHDGKRLQFFRLDGEAYAQRAESEVLSPLTDDLASEWIQDSRSQSRSVWRKRIRAWAAAHHPGRRSEEE